MPTQIMTRKTGIACVLLASVFTTGVVSADALSDSVQTESQTTQSTQTSQGRINNLAEQTDDLASDYSRVIRETETLRIYNEQLERVVSSQEQEIASVNRQLDQLESTNRGVVPLLIEMIDMLGKIVDSDMPFRLEERQDVVLDLQELIYRADVTTSEKYRRVMEAYQREIDFGRNVSSYEAVLPGTDRTVVFLKVGRTLLLYQTRDYETVGWWNPSTRNWEELGDEYKTSINKAVRIALLQEAPNLVKLPVPGAGALQ